MDNEPLAQALKRAKRAEWAFTISYYLGANTTGIFLFKEGYSYTGVISFIIFWCFCFWCFCRASSNKTLALFLSPKEK